MNNEQPLSAGALNALAFIYSPEAQDMTVHQARVTIRNRFGPEVSNELRSFVMDRVEREARRAGA